MRLPVPPTRHRRSSSAPGKARPCKPYWGYARPRAPRRPAWHHHGFLLALWCGALQPLACLMPPPIEEVVEVENRAPRIVPENLSPDPTKGPKRMTTQCLPYEFFAKLSDPDPQDVLFWRVFLDYHHDSQPQLTEIQQAESGEVIRFTVDPKDQRFAAAGRLSQPHIVELLISDRPFHQDSREPLARMVEADGITDSFMWTVTLDEEACLNNRAESPL